MRALVQGEEEDEREADYWERGKRPLYTEAKGTPGAALRVEGGTVLCQNSPRLHPRS